MVRIDNDNTSVVGLVDKIINQAIFLRASDIHLEVMEKYLRVRYRIDGILYDQNQIRSDLMFQVISRIKVLANIDIAQKRVPQDGKFNINYNNHLIDLRISTFPAIYGEKIVIRILDKTKTAIDLETLGFDEDTLNKFKKLINKSNGFILVTGPTGSGKTTTLYSALSYLHSPEKNIITLEDPVEYHIDGITQAQIHPDGGFTFAKGIRSLLRQDPDIAMIGEIRDKESAKIAIEAALTGHLVFSTLHTNNAPSAIMRLMDMSIEPFLINAAITGVMAQRLARKICQNCKYQYVPNAKEQKALCELNAKLDCLYKGKGCNECNNLGYKGRTGIFELLIMTDDLCSLIVEHPRFEAIQNQAIADGMHTLLDDGILKLKDGIISLEELIKVIA
ncbi:MAG: GspE/PulE family protein [Candidatus Babeliales bacterium]|nr:GspE/PulE family protein [Candidatus Babeliales bacterium]